MTQANTAQVALKTSTIMPLLLPRRSNAGYIQVNIADLVAAGNQLSLTRFLEDSRTGGFA